MTEFDAMDRALTPTADAAWVINAHGLDPLRDSSRESRFAISNGFLGVRAGRAVNAGRPNGEKPRTYVAGLFDAAGVEQPIPRLLVGPDWLQVRLSLSAEMPAEQADDVSGHRRTLDMRRGLLLTGGRLSGVPGVAIRLRVMRLASLGERAIGLQLLRLDVEAGEVDVELAVSFADMDFGLKQDCLEQDLAVWHTNSSHKRLAMAARASLELDGEVIAPASQGLMSDTWRCRPHAGQVLCFARWVAVTRGDTCDDDTGGNARAKLRGAGAAGWQAILVAHETAWAARWASSDVEVAGDPAAQQALRFAAYHMNGAANPADERVSIGARGLTGSDYFGHVFWDTEIFLLPFYTMTWPEAARALLMYRFHTLDAARAKAARMGWRGAMYAWESADTGDETCPEHAIGPDRQVVAILCGTREQHITSDVAYAVWHYWLATGDENFMCEAGAEILLEAGRFWCSRAKPDADGSRHIRGVIGPDEYHENVDDNAFTNVMARWTIRRAVETVDLLRARWPAVWATLSARIALTDAELRSWPAAAEAIVSGLDPRTGLFEQFAGYFALEPIDLASYAGRSVPMDVVLGRARTAKSQVVKQADVVALLILLPEEFPGPAAAANFAFYEPRCSHGSSLSRAMHALAAARLGYAEVALRYFGEASAIDLADTHVAIDGGVHVAALGGVWMTAVFGFAGVSLMPDGLALDPKLPGGWSHLGFSLHWRGRRVRIAIAPAGGLVEATLEAGDPMTVRVRGVPHELARNAALRIVDSPALPAAAE